MSTQPIHCTVLVCSSCLDSRQTQCSLVARTTAIVLGIVAIIVSALNFSGILNINNGAVVATILAPLGGLILLAGIYFQCLPPKKEEAHENPNTNDPSKPPSNQPDLNWRHNFDKDVDASKGNSPLPRVITQSHKVTNPSLKRNTGPAVTQFAVRNSAPTDSTHRPNQEAQFKPIENREPSITPKFIVYHANTVTIDASAQGIQKTVVEGGECVQLRRARKEESQFDWTGTIVTEVIIKKAVVYDSTDIDCLVWFIQNSIKVDASQMLIAPRALPELVSRFEWLKQQGFRAIKGSSISIPLMGGYSGARDSDKAKEACEGIGFVTKYS